MANSRQRRIARRAAKAALPRRALNRFRWFRWLRKHPKVSGGGGIALAFAVVLKALDWQIDGAAKTAALALLVAWLVLSFAIYISSLWDQRRPWMITIQIAAALVFALVWWAYLPIEIKDDKLNQLELVQRLASQLERETLLRQYPLGYAIFYADHANRVIPYDAEALTAYELDWNAVKLTSHPELGTVTLALPTLREKGSSTTDLAFNFSLYGPKRVGLMNCSTAMPTSDKPQRALTVCGEILAIRGSTVVFLIGLRPLQVPVLSWKWDHSHLISNS